ncbi:MAG: N-6 DNA methylase [Methylacidiphilales bacterium]|nr:N-6 DNA methylase [Candidatus Methylacidiphilales bacterium]
MDDLDTQSCALPGGKASFFTGDLKPYAWHKLFNLKLSNQDKADLYIIGIEKLSTAKHLPVLFQDIYKDAFLPFRAPDTIALFLNEINKFGYQHSEDLGNAFEYLLSIMGSQGDAGQFRTPRNIIEFIVDAVNPTKDETILDPACGTAGFLVEAYKHITKDKKLNPKEMQELAKHIHGVDIAPEMAKIARVNLYLHGFKTPLITENDTLTDEKLWGTKYDVILANPPFMTPKGGIVPHDKFSVNSNRAEVLFTDYIAEHLKLTGRAGIVIPEGIIFQSGKVYKQLRKMLVDDNYLSAVISLPAGVFNPYSGVKTSILLLDRKHAAQNKEILFIKVNNDGFDLGAQRREINKNDLPAALEILDKWKTNEKVENKIAVYVEKTKIAENGDYNLSGDRYRATNNYTNAKWPMVKLGEIAEIMKGSAITKKDTQLGNIPVIAGGQEPAYYHNKSNRTGDIITVSASGAYAGFVNYFTIPIFASDCSTIQTKDDSKVLTRYLFGILKSKQNSLYEFQQGGGQPHVYPTDLKTILIPLPPLEIQELVVAELDSYAGIIAGAKQIIKNWKPKIDIDPEWEMVKLGEFCKIERGASPRPIDKFMTDDPNGYNWVKIGDTKNADKYITQTAEKVTKEGAEKSRKVFVDDFVLSNSMSFGRPYIMKIEGYIHDGWLRLSEDPNKIEKDYLYYILSSDFVIEQFENAATGGVVRNLNSELVRKVEIPLPPLTIQKQIVEKIEAERTLVESSKKLIDIYEQKTKEAIAKLWSE